MIVVTEHGRPVVRVIPFREDRPKLVGSCKGQFQIIGDIEGEPAVPIDDWGMLADPEPDRDDDVRR